MRRALLIVLDSLGVGAAPDAADYGDAGADTLGHIVAATGVALPTLWSLGLGHVIGSGVGTPVACWGRMRPRSAGKDSTTGHWELAGVVLAEPFAVFDRFPPALVSAIEAEAGVRFIGNLAASGTAILDTLGAEHLRAGHPILYTSADSVLQIAAHEAVIPPDRLYAICAIARRHADAMRIGRVIARPFLGVPGAFVRTRRHDFSLPPPPTVLDAILGAGLPVHGIGKTADLFAGRGMTDSKPTASNEEGMRAIEAFWRDMRDGLMFANLVDFDTVHGHRRDPRGYADALVGFDRWLGRFLQAIKPADLLILTADHGNDPTCPGTDHTREEVPLLVRHASRSDPLGVRDGFADVAATLADYFGLDWQVGRGVLR